ncbi:3-phosphoshikimate 1-carboxyvinyltransferase [Anaerobiospirillum thomasii]|uniref:3-phosphoshikimate 1-carboxyvinyltransferase n=1 Tax=Anaerobiospirillum thomasii TaxID=179995 RepID=UPI000D8082AF|nr:3-phosphoshikimate 1-carboxyvinyltransferase [Anaerobiospirillum thomasii]SPT67819.1 3-phosphoshikimate 1-carboxyvinyltransferase [Anaerobiospirillum thomasii]
MTEQLKINKIDKVCGTVTMPGSKSLSNRALLLSALCSGTTVLKNVLRSDDTDRMLDALKALGVKYEDKGQCISVQGLGHAFDCSGEITLDLGNAGTAMRPLCAALSLSKGSFVLTGQVRMMERPIGPLTEALKSLGLDIEYLNNDGYPPLKIKGSEVHSHSVAISGSTSSQFISALLMVAPLCQGLEIKVVGDLISKPYVDLTIALLHSFGIKVERQGYNHFTLGSAYYKSPGSYLVEGDATSATYFMAAAAINGEVEIKGLGKNSCQGDIKFLDVLSQMGAKVTLSDESVKVVKGTLSGIDIDMNDMPDAAMTLVPMALFTNGPVRITNIASWRVKETDRISAMVTEMSKLGVKVTSGRDYIYIDGSVKNSLPVVFDTYDDHRMAMSMSLVAFDRDIIINDPKCTAKTFPNYFELLESIRA